MKLLSKKLKKKLKKQILAFPKTLAILTAVSKVAATFYLLLAKALGC